MAFIGRLHPLLIHFPIALVMAAAAAEGAASITTDDRWRTVAVHHSPGSARPDGDDCGLASGPGAGDRDVAAPRMASVTGNRRRWRNTCGRARDVGDAQPVGARRVEIPDRIVRRGNARGRDRPSRRTAGLGRAHFLRP